MEQLAFVEAQPRMTYEQIKSIVINILRGYKKLPSRIRAAERKVDGVIPPIPGKEWEHLSKVGQAYTSDNREYIHREKAENLFHAIQPVKSEDEEPIDKIRGLLIGRHTWGIDAVNWHGNAVSVATAEEMVEDEVRTLEAEMRMIEGALDDLKDYASHLEKLLRLRYIEGYSVLQSISELNISERTHVRWKKEAICEFAMLMGIIEK